MKYLLILLLLFSKVFAQTPPPMLSQRSNGTVTVVDPNLFTSRSFRPPAFLDTTTANLQNTLDSSGKMIYTFVGDKIWYRTISKSWVAIGTGSGTSFDSTYIYSLVNTKMDKTDTTVVRKGGRDTIWGKKYFRDTLWLMSKPIGMETVDNANVELIYTKVQGVAFPWFRIHGGSTFSEIVMGANNSGSSSDILTLTADYSPTITTGTYRPLTLDVYEHLDIYAKTSSNSSDSAIRFRTQSTGSQMAAIFNRAGVFISYRGAKYASNIAANYTSRSFTDKNYVDSSILASFVGGGGTLTNITATNNTGQTWTITGTSVKNISLALTSAAVGLGNVDNFSFATMNAAVATITNKNFNSGTNTFPIFNQNTTGSSAKWTTGITLSLVGDVTYSSPVFDGTSGVSGTATVTRLNGISLAGLATGILKITTGTGQPSIAVAADFPTLNQNTLGSAAKLTTARNINGIPFDGTANITVTAAANTLTGTALASTVVSSSLTSVGTLASLTVTAPIAGSVTGTASNLSGTPLLPNGTTVALQTASDSSLKLANTRYVNQAVSLAKDSIKMGTDLYLTSVAGYNVINYRNGYTRMITSGTATTVADTVKNVIFNPTSALASHTITLPANPEDNCMVTIQFILNSTTTAGSTVVTSLTISPNTGQTILQTSAPTSAVSGASYVYKFNAATSIWIRQIY